ncbi:LppX_LprAFG lipoprotein [Antrihabitans sp. YC3-6]|uniref:LppX_LprAFG lipoprotein n=1 Tax=Antrihabitans stalagmiti TaxID=2799499 RepID=A0A934NQG4_9NOCA|nr:LppX_LprAFG lipoprotein [Antrihabitans stalagmiti]MBJ8339538.1 LppX_LprAFG lipoprotein [Antrihabitans stalagmiti]
MRRSIGGLLAVLATFVCIVGCAGDGSGGLPDAQLMIRNAGYATKSISSAHLVVTADGSVPGLSIQRLDADISRESSPAASAGSAVTNLGTIDFIESDGVLFVKGPSGKYTPAPAGVALPSPAAMLDPERGISQLFSTLEAPTTLAKTELDGVAAFELRGNVPQTTLAAILPDAASGAEFTVWLRVRAPHVPLRTILTFPAGGALEFVVSDVNKPVSIAPPT